MGLTIHHELSYNGDDAQLQQALDRVRIRCTDWLKVQASPVVHIPRLHCEHYLTGGRSEPFDADHLLHRLSLEVGLRMLASEIEPISSHTSPDELQERLREHAAVVESRGYGYGFQMDVGEGAEPLTLALGTVDGKDWHGGGATKTQYAEHFVDAHLRVVAVLDLCDSEGILKKVSDEGRYWETRDLSVLAERINTYTNLLRGVTEAIRSGKVTEFGDPAAIESAVEKCANYVNVEGAKLQPRNRLHEQS